MTEPERPADPPPPASGPTPEEISARLEALLKRTHAMRQAGARPAGPMTWPPSSRELDHFDVVDVPVDQRLQPPATAGAAETAVPAGGPGFERPDWGELRLRGTVDENHGVSRWWQGLAVALALIAAAEGAYIWALRASPATGGGQARLRVDGPVGAEVRVDGRRIGAAPIEHTLTPGTYDIELAHGTTMSRARGVAVDAGRTTVMWTGATGMSTDAPAAVADSPAAASASTAPGPAASVPPPAGANTPPATTPAAGVSATLGAVLIESTPAGLPVTMEGRPRGVTPITIGRLKPGRHDVLVGGLARQVDVTANATATLRVTRQ